MQAMGIDIGTTTISIVLVDEASGAVTARDTIEHKAFLKGEEKRQDPERIWALTNEHVESMVHQYGKPACIGLTGQMHGMLYVNQEGAAVSQLYTWQDESGNQMLPDGTTSVERLCRHVGYAAAGYGLATHYYLQRQGKIPEDAVKMTTISDYIAMKLTGRKIPVIGRDMAASWGCFDLEKGNFLYEKLQKEGVNTTYLPEVEKEPVIVGKTETQIPVMVSLGDNQASVFGSMAQPENTLLVNIGTGSQVSMTVEKYVACENALELRPFLKDQYIMVGAGLCGGRAYAMLEQFYREITGKMTDSFYDRMLVQAEEFLASSGMEEAWKIQTTFSGTRGNPLARGSISGISTENFHPGALTVGMMMGILKELKDAYDQMGLLTGKSAQRLVGSGNGIRKNPVMRRLAESMFGMELLMPLHEEEAAVGAALCSLVAAGIFSGPGEAQKRIAYSR